MRRKVLVIGLDGATFDLIRPWAEEGKLENFKRLLKEGVSGDLESVFPPITASAWTSFLTGVNPGKHGVFSWTLREKNSYKTNPINSSSIRAKTLPDVLERYGKTCGILNLPLTYPPKRVRGFVISGMDTPSMEHNFTYPESLKRELQSRIPDYRIDIDNILYGERGLRRFLKDLKSMIEERKKATMHLLRKHETDLFVSVFVAIDRVQHIFWKFLNENHPVFRETIFKTYLEIDGAVGEILRKTDDETTLIFVSDHGAGPLKKMVYINTFLQRNGLLNIRQRFRVFCYLNQILDFLPFDVLRPLIYMLQKSSKEKGFFTWLKFKNFFRGMIVWSKTKAYSGDKNEQGIYINLKGREPKGTVEADEYEALRDYIIEKLLELKDEDTGERIVKKVFKREKIYSGPFVRNSPDILIATKNESFVASDEIVYSHSVTKKPLTNRLSGIHRMNGIFLIKGPNIKKGIEILNAKIVDVAPTILYVLGVPIPKYMDGRVLYEIFEEDFFKKNPPRYIDLELESKREKEIYSKKDRERIKERLKGLGYVS